jgi:hypothetical protein
LEISVTTKRRRSAGLVATLLLALGLAACGSQGYAAPLGKPATATLTAAGASAATYAARITPINAVHVVVSYHGHTLPLTGAPTPAQMRRDSCFGAYVAPLTDGNPAQPAEAPGVHDATVASAPDPSGGMDVEVAPGASLFVDVLARPNDPTAPVVACGQPLSGRRQYFDLYSPTNNSVAIGNALFDPITAAQVAISPSGGSSSILAPVSWTIHTGSCDGLPVGGHTIAAGAKAPYGGTVYAALAPGNWWVTLALSDGTTLCGQTKTG